MRRITFQLRLSIIFISLLIMVLGGATYFIYQRLAIQQRGELRKNLLSLATLVSMQIDVQKLLSIVPQRESEATPAYQEIQSQLKRVREIDPVIDSVYTMARTGKDNLWFFLVDSGDRHGTKAYCGEPYDVSDAPEMRLAFEGPIVDKNINQDPYGRFLSGYAPIYDKSGHAVAIVGIDVRAESIENMRSSLARKSILVLAIGIVFSLLLSWSVARSIAGPLHSLMSGIREAGKGNLEYKVKVNSKDEFGELASAFNRMTAELQGAQQKLQRYYLDTIKSLALALEAKDPYTRGHSERVTEYAVNIAQHLGLSKNDIETLRETSMLHDIGKIGLPENILTKPGPLSEEEMRLMRMHPSVGEEILKPIEFLRPGIRIVSEHHERVDGKGYPRGLKGDEISVLAAIVAIADAFDAMTSDRPYRKAMTKEEAIARLKENSGTQFDSRAVEAFMEYLKKDTDKTDETG